MTATRFASSTTGLVGSQTRSTPGGPWLHYKTVPVSGFAVPVARLEIRVVTELFRDRKDRSEPLLAHMQETGCDLDLVEQALEEARLPTNVRESVLLRLGRS